jgi:hypothetical protein
MKLLEFFEFICEHTSATMRYIDCTRESVTLSSGIRHKSVTNRKRDGNVIEIKIPKLLELRDRRTKPKSETDTIEVEVEVDKEKDKKESQKPKSKKRPKIAMPLPLKAALEAGRLPDDRYEKYARGKGVTIDLFPIFERFCTHHEKLGSTFASWYAAWRTWIQNAEKWNPEYFEKKATPGTRIKSLYDEFAREALWLSGKDLEAEYSVLRSKIWAVERNHLIKTISELRAEYAKP